MTTALEDKWTAADEEDKTLQAVRFRKNEKDREELKRQIKKDFISPPGGIPNLSPLLEYRRLEYSIPDMLFAAQPLNNKVNIFQVDAVVTENNTFQKDGVIVMPDQMVDARVQTAPKGIIVGAGLEALDNMYTHGYWEGHLVNFISMNPYRKQVGTIAGRDQYVLCMTAGDIVDSDDLATYRRAGKVRVARREFTLDDGTTGVEHYLQDPKTGKTWDPSSVGPTDEEIEENKS